MSKTTKDPLLGSAKVLVMVFIGLLAFTGIMVAIGIGACLTVARGELFAKLAEAGAPEGTYWAVLAILLGIEGLLFIAFRFLLELRGIIRSVDAGDPFRPENADRLSRMGWLTVAAYAVALPLGGLAAWVQRVAEQAGGELEFDVNFDGGGILLILVLFILARVFRHGALMREELDGTV